MTCVARAVACPIALSISGAMLATAAARPSMRRPASDSCSPEVAAAAATHSDPLAPSVQPRPAHSRSHGAAACGTGGAVCVCVCEREREWQGVRAW
jgi:hypothetical protein